MGKCKYSFSKIIAIGVLILICLFYYSNAIAGPKGANSVQNTGIITPDVATGFYATENYTNDSRGNLLVCVYPARRDIEWNCLLNGKNAWQHVSTVPPTGKTYVGFRVVSREYGYRQLEIYWK